MLDLIVETDLGHDPDDFFTLCYLAAAGVRLRALCVVPGDRQLVAVARDDADGPEVDAGRRQVAEGEEVVGVVPQVGLHDQVHHSPSVKAGHGDGRGGS